jgi:hypothetical protein
MPPTGNEIPLPSEEEVEDEDEEEEGKRGPLGTYGAPPCFFDIKVTGWTGS